MHSNGMTSDLSLFKNFITAPCQNESQMQSHVPTVKEHSQAIDLYLHIFKLAKQSRQDGTLWLQGIK